VPKIGKEGTVVTLDQVEKELLVSNCNHILTADCLEILPEIEENSARLVIADPPYFRVLTSEAWDNQWADEGAYLEWALRWMRLAMRALMPGGLLYCFGQTGKREQVWLQLIARACAEFEYHDLIVWDRAVGYNERRDSFTPAYEMILVLRKAGAVPFFDKDAVREPYNRQTQARYLKDKRYKNLMARREHLKRGKYATNVWRVPSLKGTSREKCGHPAQKPEEIIRRLVLSSSAPNDLVIDPFAGCGTVGAVCEKLGRRCLSIEINPHFAEIARQRSSKMMLQNTE
jgi:site-specific DNA-methyltransferase (adenine-specific)